MIVGFGFAYAVLAVVVAIDTVVVVVVVVVDVDVVVVDAVVVDSVFDVVDHVGDDADGDGAVDSVFVVVAAFLCCMFVFALQWHLGFRLPWSLLGHLH